MRKLLNIIALLLVACSLCGSTKVEIFGHAHDYANNQITFYKYADRISYVKQKLFTLFIDENGYFNTVFDLDSTTYVFAEYEIYHAYMYVEPGKKYEIILPDYVAKPPQDNFNPFFTPQHIHIGIKNMSQTDLNYMVLNFDYFYNRYVDLKLQDLYAKGLKTDVDTFINALNDKFQYADNQYFNDYKKYRILTLKNIVTQKKYEGAIVGKYFADEPVLYENPAYMDLFNNIYADYFDNCLTGENGKYLLWIIHNGHSITRLRKFLKTNAKLKNPEYCDLVILKGLNDAFPNYNFSWYPLLLTLDSLHLSARNKLQQTIAQNIADNNLSMSKGTVAPPFELYDSLGKVHHVYDYQGKYLYLSFANTTTYGCKSDFDLMKKLCRRYEKSCRFVTIITDDDTVAARNFIKKNNYNWDFLFAKINSPVVATYKIEAFPTYFFVDAYGFLLMSPAPAPSEDIENVLFRLTRDDKKQSTTKPK